VQENDDNKVSNRGWRKSQYQTLFAQTKITYGKILNKAFFG
jgi:hypothetical protein